MTLRKSATRNCVENRTVTVRKWEFPLYNTPSTLKLTGATNRDFLQHAVAKAAPAA
jgi:hypothetical protein